MVDELRKTNDIIVISGLSGSGKSSLLMDIAHQIRAEQPPVKIVQTGLSGDGISGKQLLDEAKALGTGTSALFIDNADSIEDISATLDEICRKYDVTVFVTGKNGALLESRITNSGTQGHAGMSGRAVIRCGPFSYAEFLEFHGLAESRRSCELYARTGGLPDTGISSPDTPAMAGWLAHRANSFVLTDIVERSSIRNPSHVRSLLRLVARATGEALTARQICEAFAADRLTISPQSALDYLSACRDAGLLVPVPVYDLNRERKIDSGSAWYFADNGLRSAFTPDPSPLGRESPAETDRAVENLALLKLIDDGWAVMQGRVGLGGGIREHISFVCERDGERRYLQIIGNHATAAERLRKRKALLSVHDAWPKHAIDTDDDRSQSLGVIRNDIRLFLLHGISS
jgi:uncharacterized protein